jgi:hypothetical protein
MQSPPAVMIAVFSANLDDVVKLVTANIFSIEKYSNTCGMPTQVISITQANDEI